MHEFSLCQQLIVILQQRLSTDQLYQIKTVWVKVGQLAGVDQQALCFAFPLAAKQAGIAQAELKLIIVEARGYCQSCEQESAMAQLFSACENCGKLPLTVLQGEQLLIDKVELR